MKNFTINRKIEKIYQKYFYNSKKIQESFESYADEVVQKAYTPDHYLRVLDLFKFLSKKINYYHKIFYFGTTF